MNRTIESPSLANRYGPVGAKATVAALDETETSHRQTKAGSAKTVEGRPERRTQRRTRVSLPVRLRPADMKDGDTHRVLRTKNSSRESLYFTAASGNFYESMRLRIVFPFTSEHDAVQASEEYGQIIRVDELPNGQKGIAVLLQGSSRQPGNRVVETKPASRPRQAGERRITLRQPFSATAAVFDKQSGARVQARCSDLSVSGCYVDTINPFSEKARVHVRLSRGNTSFETEALVCFSQMNFGMGLAFPDLTPDQELTLVEWLNSSPVEPQPIQVTEQPAKPANSEASALTERGLALRLIHLLRSKGNLAEADVTMLLSKYLATDEEVACRPCSDRL